MTITFEVTRASGKSNQQVIVELVCNAAPDTLFTYERLAAALADGSDIVYDRHAVQSCVRMANRRLLEEHQRCLEAVRGSGYRIIRAGEHHRIAVWRNRRGCRQYREAMRTLQNVRTDEMTPEERQRHDAQLVINSALAQAVRSQQKQSERMSELIAGLTHRVEQLEAKKQ